MRLNANVRQVTGSTTHAVGSAPLATAARVEIRDSEGGFLLLRYAADGAFAGDTWHASIDDAKRQALIEYSIEPADWE